MWAIYLKVLNLLCLQVEVYNLLDLAKWKSPWLKFIIFWQRFLVSWWTHYWTLRPAKVSMCPKSKQELLCFAWDTTRNQASPLFIPTVTSTVQMKLWFTTGYNLCSITYNHMNHLFLTAINRSPLGPESTYYQSSKHKHITTELVEFAAHQCFTVFCTNQVWFLHIFHITDNSRCCWFETNTALLVHLFWNSEFWDLPNITASCLFHLLEIIFPQNCRW